MRSVADWEEEDLLALIGQQESLHLDFKQSPKLNKGSNGREGLSKMVSALANADGGILVYGVIEDGHVATGLDAGLDPNDITKEWVEQVISSTISPKVERIVIKQIARSGDAAGKVSYAIHVPRAVLRAPHQANDKKYYKRSNFECVPMEDYEVREALRRESAPAPVLYLNFRVGEEVGDDLNATLEVVIGSESSEPILYRQIVLSLDGELVPELGEGVGWRDRRGKLRWNEGLHPVAVFTKNEMVPSAMPLYAETAFKIGTFSLRLSANTAYPIAYNLNCPGFRKYRTGAIRRDARRVIIWWDTE